MTNKEIALDNEEYLITPSLLNAWSYIFTCVNYVRESQKDEISLEDKQSDAQERAYCSFLDTLNRLPSEPNEAMQKGIDFEEECYKGNTIVSPIIENGAFQIVGKKHLNVGGMKFLLYGRLDVLKGGVIYDIKRVASYTPQKYQKTFQHPCYFELFKSAKEFTYLVYDDNNKLHFETYYKDECEPVENIISRFISFLESKGLLEIYKKKWKTEGGK